MKRLSISIDIQSRSTFSQINNLKCTEWSLNSPWLKQPYPFNFYIIAVFTVEKNHSINSYTFETTFTSQCLAASTVWDHSLQLSICYMHRYRHGSWNWLLHARSFRDEISSEDFRLDRHGWSMVIRCLASVIRCWWSHPYGVEQRGTPSHTNYGHAHELTQSISEHRQENIDMQQRNKLLYLTNKFQVSLFITPEGSRSWVISWLSLKCALSNRMFPPGDVSSMKPKSMRTSLPTLHHPQLF